MTDASAVVAQVLLVSGDRSAVQEFTSSITQLAMSVQVCSDVNSALRLLHEQKFEAIIVDLAMGELAPTLLEQVRLSASNRTIVTFAISANREQSGIATNAGAKFVLERPLSPELIATTMKAAYGMIVRERRRYFRCPIKVPAIMQPQSGTQVMGQTVNVSEHGMALVLPVALEAGSEATVQFSLPEIQDPIVAQARVCWRNGKGQAGLFFLNISQRHSSDLQAWLARRLEAQLPESVVGKFRQTSGA